MQRPLPLALHQMLAHQYNVSGLRIREYFVSHIVSISILKAARKCQQAAEQERL